MPKALWHGSIPYAHGKGIFEVQLLCTGFEEDGGWFFGNVDFPTFDYHMHVVLSAQPTEILGTKGKLPRQRALGLVFERNLLI